MKQLINKKRIGNKFYMSEVIVDDKPYKDNGIKIINTTEYRTKGESVLLVKDVDSSKILLDSSTTNHIRIKTLTRVIIRPIIGKIDEEYDEIFIDKGACVELLCIDNLWYILSSDGLKLD
jgi:hypothetical protein